MVRSHHPILLFCIVSLFLACALLCSGCVETSTGFSTTSDEKGVNSSVTVVDNLGRAITLEKPASSIVSLSSDATVLLLVIGAGDTLKGVSGTPLTYTYMAEKMPNAVSVGGNWGSSPAVEKILVQDPDIVVLTTTTDPSVADKLDKANIPYIYIDGYKLKNVREEVYQLGVLTGRTDGAENYILFYDRCRDLISDRLGTIQKEDRPTVYFEGNSEFSTVGNSSGGDSLIKMAYGENIAGDLNITWPVVTPEWVIQENPDVFIKIAYPTSLNTSTIQDIYNTTLHRSSISPTSAVKNERVYVINHKITYNTVGIVALVYMAKAFYPDRFSDIDPEELLSEYDREFLPGSKPENPFYPLLPSDRRET